jgi:glycosyltransferase involved in cell wall biosynthesis
LILPIPLSGRFRKYSPVRRLIAHRKYASDLRKLISANTPDIVLSGNTPIDIQIELLWYCRTRGIGFVHWVQDIYYRAVEFFLRRKLGAAFSRLLSAPLRLLEMTIAAHSDAVIAISPGFREEMGRWGIGESKLSVIENWAPLEEVPLAPRDNNWSRAHELGAKPILLYSGTLGLKHRPDLLYLLAQKLAGLCQVVVLTDGFGKEHLEKMPRLENLLILGFQPYKSIPAVLASADVLLGTLEADAGQFAVPSKILTYLCAGRPILLAGPKNNLAASIIERSKAGLVVDPDDPAAWIRAARELIANPAYRAELGVHARRYAETTFDIVRIAAAFERVLVSSLIRSKQTAPAAPSTVSSAN